MSRNPVYVGRLLPDLSWLALVALLTASALPAEAVEPPQGVRDDTCAEGVGGFGESDVTGTEAISWWRGEWDAVKELTPQALPARMTKACLCLRSSDYTPTRHDFNVVVYAADGAGGLPGTRLLSLPFQATLDRLTHNFFGFDLAGAGPVVSDKVYVGVHSVTSGPLDPRQLFLCQYPRGTAAAPTFYRLPNWTGATWNPYYYAQVGDVPQVGIRASFDDSAAEPEPTCTSSATTACLGNGRFKVEASYDGGAEHSGQAQVGAMGSDTGYLTFFREGNVEALVKVLDGCAVNGHHWVFIGGLTNVGVTITVTDTVSGHTRTYRNPRGRAFQPVQDTSALPCS